MISDADLLDLKESKGKYAPFLSDICKFYRDFHVKSDRVHGNFSFYFNVTSYASTKKVAMGMMIWLLSGIFLHDPVSFVAVVRPDLFTYKKGVVRVETQGICVGHTLMDQGLKKFVQIYNYYYYALFFC